MNHLKHHFVCLITPIQNALSHVSPVPQTLNLNPNPKPQTLNPKTAGH
jgi:hypothetical protein